MSLGPLSETWGPAGFPADMVPDLFLDPELLTWVLCPVLGVMFLVGLIRHYVTELLAPGPKRVEDKEKREQAYLRYGRSVGTNYYNVPGEYYAGIVQTLAPKFRDGAFLADPEAKPVATGLPDLTDPRAMEGLINSMRTQVLTYVPQTLLMSWVSALFGGFVVMKLPFPLTLRFKKMLQAGILTPDLDVRWVSSVSWYILLLLGLSSVFALVLGANNKASQRQNQTMPMNFGPGVDMRKLFSAGADSLELVHHQSVLDGIEKRILAL